MTKRQRMPGRLGFVHGEPCSGCSLIGTSLSERIRANRDRAATRWSINKADDRVHGAAGAGQSALEVLARAGLVSEIMKDDPSHAIGGAQSSLVARGCCELAELIGDCQGCPIFASVHPMRPKPTERPQLIFNVVEALGNFLGSSSRPLRSRIRGRWYSSATHPMPLEDAIPAADRGLPLIQPGEGAFDVPAALGHHRQVDPQRHRGSGQGDADRCIASWRKCPVKRGAEIVDFPRIIRQPFVRRPRQPPHLRRARRVRGSARPGDARSVRARRFR